MRERRSLSACLDGTQAMLQDEKFSEKKGI